MWVKAFGYFKRQARAAAGARKQAHKVKMGYIFD
jgi:hypothetical protein